MQLGGSAALVTPMVPQPVPEDEPGDEVLSNGLGWSNGLEWSDGLDWSNGLGRAPLRRSARSAHASR